MEHMTITPEMRQRVDDYILDLPRIINRPLQEGEEHEWDAQEEEFFVWLGQEHRRSAHRWPEVVEQMPAQQFRKEYLELLRKFHHGLANPLAGMFLITELYECHYECLVIEGVIEEITPDEIASPEQRKAWAEEIYKEPYVSRMALLEKRRRQSQGLALPPTPEEAREEIIECRRRVIEKVRKGIPPPDQRERTLASTVFRRALARGEVKPISLAEILDHGSSAPPE